LKNFPLKIGLPFFILGVLGWFIGYLVQPDSLQRYVARLMTGTSQILAEGQKIQYIDVDGDGNSEEFIYYHLSDNRQPVINRYSSDGTFQAVWYLDGEVIQNFDFIWGDCNGDGLQEVMVFSQEKNHIFLYGLEPGNKNSFFADKIEVCGLPEEVDNQHLVIRSAGVVDLNKDGFCEAVFSVNSRFTEQPRGIYAFDAYHQKLLKSPELGMQVIGTPVFFDIDQNGTPEIFLSTFNSTNQAWVNNREQALSSSAIVLRSDLSYYSLPVLYQSRMSVSMAFPVHLPSHNYIGSLSWPLNESEKPRLLLQNYKGEMIRQKVLDEGNFVFDPARSDWSSILAFQRNGWVYEFNTKLELSRKIDLKGITHQVNYLDVDNDGKEEILVVQNNNLSIYRSDFTNPVTIEIPGLNIQKVYFSLKKRAQHSNLLSVFNDNHQYLVSYSENQAYWFRFVLYALSIFGLWFLYWLYIKLYHIHFDNVRFTNEKFYKMQLELIRNQLDPHFLFNALNSIAFSINSEDKKIAYANLGLFSKFLREAIVSLDEFSRSLDEEIDYVKNYLMLEKFRFKEKFSYSIVVSPGINRSIQVPKLILFSFTESALKKGVLVKPEGGNIHIVIDADDQQNIFIQISDDGIWRNLETSDAAYTKNMLMIDQVVNYFNSFNQQKITLKLFDRGTEQSPQGTLVEITIPAVYQYLAE